EPSKNICLTTWNVSVEMMLANGGSSALFATITRWSAESKQISSALFEGLLGRLGSLLTVEIGFVAPAGAETNAPDFGSKSQTRLLPSPTHSCVWSVVVSTPSGPETSLLATHVPVVGGPHTIPLSGCPGSLILPRAPTNVFGVAVADTGLNCETIFVSVSMT